MARPRIGLQRVRQSSVYSGQVGVPHDLEQIARTVENVSPVGMLEQIAGRAVFQMDVARIARGHPLHEPADGDVRNLHHQPRVARRKTEGDDLRASTEPRGD